MYLGELLLYVSEAATYGPLQAKESPLQTMEVLFGDKLGGQAFLHLL